MSARLALGAALLALTTTSALAQFDPTNPEGSPLIGRSPRAVVSPYGPYGPYAPYEPLGMEAPLAPARAPIPLDPQSLNTLQTDPAAARKMAEAISASLDAKSESEIKAMNMFQADASGNMGVEIDPDITHQPLIHVKVRVVEVQRTDDLAVSSVLDFITSSGGTSPFGTAPFNNTINGSDRRLAGINRFPVTGLLDVAGEGSGMLINLSSAHINWVASLLATEFNADTITAPQVTTLNGKTVQFRGGDWIPFALGANLIQGDTNTIQEVFYRHVGTYIRVTPQIVNWNERHEGLGRVQGERYSTMTRYKLREDDIMSLDGALSTLVYEPFFSRRMSRERLGCFQRYLERRESADAVRRELLLELNGLMESGVVSRSALNDLMGDSIRAPSVPQPGASDCEHCNWKPSECTINLNIAVRLSDPGTGQQTVESDGEVVPITVTTEQNVRAISNVVQVKSGGGVVLGGLITMRDQQQLSKVPFVGDIPVLGAAFRSTQTSRIKTETLIFVQAEVLPGFDNCYDECGENLVKSRTSRDFCDSRIHIQGPLCEGPLSQGMHRAGLQSEYLPRPSVGERQYWQYYRQTMRHLRRHRQTTHALDMIE